ncbi:hypothetical protein Q1695_006047 [Nippostrongylus brasiliensis]|nr:hypothetical protein Q1695_006047 [Nippostrongylus brasiliensis]
MNTFDILQVNTTGTCQMLTDLRSSTRYIVYVTSRNDYGVSVPSVRSIASTNVHILKSNDTVPDVMKCCKETKYQSSAVRKCARRVVTECICHRLHRHHMSGRMAKGVAMKGVQNDCLPICAGSTESLGVHSVLCLNLDLQAIYQCLREGYESHPSPPVNVSVTSVSESSAEITWDEPDSNAHLVDTYTLMIRKVEHGARVREKAAFHSAIHDNTTVPIKSKEGPSIAVLNLH